jgi:peptide/nickel transport system ATP-binding protein
MVMYGGKVMELCDADNLENAKHPYTRGLLNCLPQLDQAQDELPVMQRDPAWVANSGAVE